MSRITIELDAHLHHEVELLAAESGRTLSQVVQDALRAMLAETEREPKGRKVELRTFKGNGTLPGIDLDDSAGLLDILDQDRPL